MAARVFAFVLFLAAGGAAGWWIEGERGAQAGLLLGAGLWFTFETERVLRLLVWLRRGDVSSGPGRGS